MTGQLPPLVQRLLDKVIKSRDLSISFLIHAILVVIFGGVILTKSLPPPETVRAVEGELVLEKTEVPKEPATQSGFSTTATTFSVVGAAPTNPVIVVETPSATLAHFQAPVVNTHDVVPPDGPKAPAPRPRDEMTPEIKRAMQEFTNWQGTETGSRAPKYIFTAYIGQYQGGNWDSTVRMSQGKIETGSLPNLLYLMSHWSKDRVQTNYQNVQAIRLDSDELITTRPPFIFLTGTRDFTLTDKEVDNLRHYLRLGGCIWGDSSVPGQKSRFDIAFKREMRRVIGGDEDFAPLPSSHPLFSKPYFSEVRSVPAGLNSYQLPVTALKIYGEVAVIYTANDYGDMWQIGLDAQGKIDLRRDASGRPVAVNEDIYARRGTYVRNLSPAAIETSFKFGANVVMHLLTRWDAQLGRASAL